MESLYLLIPLSVMAVVVAVLVFFWMNKNGQFDDDQGPAWSILLDDDRPVQAQKSAEDNGGERSNETDDKLAEHQNKTSPEGH